jgi:integrase
MTNEPRRLRSLDVAVGIEQLARDGRVGLASLEQTVKVVMADGKRRRRIATNFEGIRPYDLRHSFASLLIREGRLSLAEIADQLGNSVATLSEVSAHVIADMKGQPRTSADDAIMQARLKRTEQAL